MDGSIEMQFYKNVDGYINIGFLQSKLEKKFSKKKSKTQNLQCVPENFCSGSLKIIHIN